MGVTNKHVMDEVAAEKSAEVGHPGLFTPNDPCVIEEAKKRLLPPDYEERVSNKAEELAQLQCSREFSDLPPEMQMRIWMEAERDINDDLADGAELRLSNR